MAPASAASGYSFEFGARYWYSSGSSPRTFTTIRASPTISSRGWRTTAWPRIRSKRSARPQRR